MAKEKKGSVSAEKAYAYTPGLKVKRAITVQRIRLLPIFGEVLVKKNEVVDFDTIVARAYVPGKPNIIKVNEILHITPDITSIFMVKNVGDKVDEGELIAKYTPFWGLFKKLAYSPVSGIVETISDVTGQVVIREPPIPVAIKAYISGIITNVIPKRGIIVETPAAFIQGIFGIGGEKHGELSIVVESNEDILTADKIKPEDKGKILVGGSLVTLKTFKRAEELGIKGIIAGGIKSADLKEILGYEIGVAITGQESVKTTLVITEGFGSMKLSTKIFNLLKDYEGHDVAINGSTQIRAGVIRPEIIIPQEKYMSESSAESIDKGMIPGTPVRMIREPYFGSIGKVLSLPVHLQKIPTESFVRVLEIELEEGKVIVPRANVEIIEE